MPPTHLQANRLQEMRGQSDLKAGACTMRTMHHRSIRAACCNSIACWAQPFQPTTWRRSQGSGVPIAAQGEPVTAMPQVVNNDDCARCGTIPSSRRPFRTSIEDYQVDLPVSTELHGLPQPTVAPRRSQAPMVSITHFMDRDGQFLATVSPRRYFCNQCHVGQTRGETTLSTTTFVDVDYSAASSAGRRSG